MAYCSSALEKNRIKQEKESIAQVKTRAQYELKIERAHAGYSDDCAEIGIKGDNVWEEMQDIGNAVYGIYCDVVEMIRDKKVADAVGYYSDFSAFMHGVCSCYMC